MKTIKKFSELVNEELNIEDLSQIKGGLDEFEALYGCVTNICTTNREGGIQYCTEAVCKSGIGPVSHKDDDNISVYNPSSIPSVTIHA